MKRLAVDQAGLTLGPNLNAEPETKKSVFIVQSQIQIQTNVYRYICTVHDFS